MNNLLNSWWARAALVGLGTWAVWKYAPLGATGKTIVLAVGGVSASLIVAGNVPLVNMALSGRLPLPAATTAGNG